MTSWQRGGVPRVVSVPSDGVSYSSYAKQVGSDLGMPLDADQCEILDAIYQVRPDGQPACFEVAIVAPRQNIKTSTLEIAALTDLFVFREPLHIWTAHLFDTSQKTFKHMQSLIGSNPEYQDLCRWPPRKANGDEAIELLTGESIEFYARSKRAARGFAGVGKITLDEALFLDPDDLGAILPTTAVVPGAQIRYGSSAGMADSAALRGIRDRGHASAAGLGYFEWYAPKQDCQTPHCAHYLDAVGCALDDPALLAEANPALGRRISLERLQQFRQAMPPAEFAREFLGWWDEDPNEGRAIPHAAWKAISDELSEPSNPITYGLAVADDRSWACVGAAGNNKNGLCHVEIGTYRPTPAWVVDYLADLASRRKVRVVIRPGSQAGSLIPALEQRKVDIVKASQQDYAAACGDFRDSVVSRQDLRHLGQPALDVAVSGAQSRRIGDAAVWDQRNPSTDISPLEAVTLAAWGFRQKPARTGRFIAF